MAIGSVVVAELMKVRTRWLPYVLLLVALVGATAQIWLLGYVGWLQDRHHAEYDFGEDSRRAFTLPYAIPRLISSGQYWGAILVGVLTASVVATEYGWGTVRQALARGQSRAEYLTGKLLGISLISTVGLLFVLGLGIAFSVLATSVADFPVTLDVRGGPSLFDVAMMVVRAGWCIVPYGLLAFCLTTLGRSTALGTAGIVLYIIAEGIVTAVLGGIGGVTADFRVLIIGHNVAALMAENSIDVNSGSASGLAPRSEFDVTDLPDPWAAAVVIGVYCVVLLVITYWAFGRRDVRSGGE